MCHACGVDQATGRTRKPVCKDPLCTCVWTFMNCSGRPPPNDNWYWIPGQGSPCCAHCVSKHTFREAP